MTGLHPLSAADAVNPAVIPQDRIEKHTLVWMKCSIVLTPFVKKNQPSRHHLRKIDPHAQTQCLQQECHTEACQLQFGVGRLQQRIQKLLQSSQLHVKMDL